MSKIWKTNVLNDQIIGFDGTEIKWINQLFWTTSHPSLLLSQFYDYVYCQLPNNKAINQPKFFIIENTTWPNLLFW